MIRRFKHALAMSAVALAIGALATVHPVQAAEENHYKLVENWAQFPPGVTKWGAATGVDVDSHDNVYIFHRNEDMPIMAFDRNGKFLHAWGKGMFKTTHFIRTDRAGDVWVTDRGDMVAYKFSPEGKLLLTIGKKGVLGDNNSHDTFNGMADVWWRRTATFSLPTAKGRTRVIVKFTKDGTFVKWWGGKGKEPGQFDVPHDIAIDSKGLLYVGDRSNDRVQVFDQDGKFIKQFTNLGTPWGVFVKGNKLYVVDGTKNSCLYIANAKDGKVLEKIEGLANPTAVTVDSKGAIYIGEVTAANVKKFVKK
jgi:hypothetical protein